MTAKNPLNKQLKISEKQKQKNKKETQKTTVKNK